MRRSLLRFMKSLTTDRGRRGEKEPLYQPLDLGCSFSDVCIKRTQSAHISYGGQRSWLTANCKSLLKSRRYWRRVAIRDEISDGASVALLLDDECRVQKAGIRSV